MSSFTVYLSAALIIFSMPTDWSIKIASNPNIKSTDPLGAFIVFCPCSVIYQDNQKILSHYPFARGCWADHVVTTAHKVNYKQHKCITEQQATATSKLPTFNQTSMLLRYAVKREEPPSNVSILEI